jgi:murein L,D-transpeptidase YafK
LRLFLASAAITAAVVIAGCDSEKIPNISGRHMQPLSEATLAELDTKNMAKESPILIRIFKEESELELWKVDKSGRFALLQSYPICRWSGDLGPKVQEGDRQAPEGFYTITPELMNPTSYYHLAINTGFPNAYDRVNGRTGASLMIHGDCASVGCYAMTDEQIAEIYSLAREAFFGGQRSFQIQAYPFRMNPLNMARHRNSPHLAFWKVLKEGHDHFEVTRKEPKVAVCDKQYVFDANPLANSTRLTGAPRIRFLNKSRPLFTTSSTAMRSRPPSSSVVESPPLWPRPAGTVA